MQAVVPPKSSLTGGITWFSPEHRGGACEGEGVGGRKGQRQGTNRSRSVCCLGVPRRPVAPRPGPEVTKGTTDGSSQSQHALAPWEKARGVHPQRAALPGTC